ncbi:MAG: tRNA uridine-5-carboxymethylaminomethyl(34) synthesis GTPase MnmE [Betaproteobacteria bacterium]|nr:tRNA uridine-5-carboxymethylaminomethyl(34) synthesis GTPase MnmE [Betaproteobacteria bacterium]
MLSERDAPIIAVATPPGKGAVGIVRISGKDLRGFANTLCGQSLEPRRAYLTTIRDEDGQTVDQVLALFFPAPHSYTGEDVLELQGHGGPVVLAMLVEHCLTYARRQNIGLADLRLALPGEFTQRAYLNQKMDLAQAEAVSDVIDAQTQAAVRGAGRSLVGAFSKQVEKLQEQLLRVRMLVEASLDFPEEDIDFVTQADVAGQLEAMQEETSLLFDKTRQGALLRDGMKMVIAGQPNAGKSSLLNALTGQDTAIVTPVAGTTRDVLTQTISIEGVPVHVVDTAGLRDTQSVDEVEKIGIERAWAQVKDADVLLLLHDLSRNNDAAYEARQTALNEQILQQKNSRSPLLHVFNKTDLVTALRESADQQAAMCISAKTGQGLPELRARLLQSVGWLAEHQEGVFSARQRHVQALEQVQIHIAQALGVLQTPSPALDLLAEELRCAQQQLSCLTGTMTADDLLGDIFSRFCIGK